MATWDIDVHQARAVIAQAGTAADGCGQRMSTAHGRLDAMAALAECSPTVAAALQAHRTAVEGDRRAADERAESVTNAGNEALAAYNQGDHEMVLNAQRASAAVPDLSGMLSGGTQA